MKIEVLYPEIANLYGDLENVTYLQKSNPEIEVVETHLTDVPLFVREKPALVYMGTMTERAQLLVIEALKPHLAALQERIADGTLFLMTGNALEIFGSRIEDVDGTSVECLGLFPTTAKRDMMHRYTHCIWENSRRWISWGTRVSSRSPIACLMRRQFIPMSKPPGKRLEDRG